MSKAKVFDYDVTDGRVSRIRSAETSKFLRIGELPLGTDRSMTKEALDTVGYAFQWSEAMRERDKAKE